MRRTPAETARLLPGIVLLSICLSAVGCRPEIVVRLVTTVYDDGGMNQTIDVRGRTPEGETPTGADWLEATGGVGLAAPDGWERIDTGRGRLRAERYAAPGVPVGAPLAYRVAGRLRTPTDGAERTVERRGIATRWTYTERHGDPVDDESFDATIDAMLALAEPVLERELARWLGDEVGLEPAVDAFRRSARELARTTRSAGPAARDEEVDPFDAANETLRNAVIDALRRSGVEVDGLGFWPDGLDDDRWEPLIARHWPDEGALEEALDPLLETAGGYFGNQGSPRFRFDVRVRLPGRLVATNGAPDDGASFWIVRGDDLRAGGTAPLLRAVSLETDREALVALGARTELDVERLVRLHDLLWERDPDGRLAARLDAAIAAGSLDALVDEDSAEDDALAPLLDELHRLLSPAE